MTHTGFVQVSVIAGPLHPTPQPVHDELGQQFTMNDDFHLHLTPETARQWITTLTPIATKEDK